MDEDRAVAIDDRAALEFRGEEPLEGLSAASFGFVRAWVDIDSFGHEEIEAGAARIALKEEALHLDRNHAVAKVELVGFPIGKDVGAMGFGQACFDGFAAVFVEEGEEVALEEGGHVAKARDALL